MQRTNKRASTSDLKLGNPPRFPHARRAPPEPRSRRRLPRRGRIVPAPLGQASIHRSEARVRGDQHLPHRRAGRPRRGLRPLRSPAGSPTTRAAIAIAPSARRWRGPSGSSGARPSCCRFLTSISSSRCRRRSRRLALQNKRLLYGMLFEAASQTIAEVAANPRHLGAHEVGILAVLHTWGQNLMHHPHLHCVVSGGGLSRTASAGSPRSPITSCRCASSAACSVATTVSCCVRPMIRDSSNSTASWRRWPSKRAFQKLVGRGRLAASGSSMPSGLSGTRPACSSTWPATRIAWPSPTVDWSATTPVASPSGTRIMPTTAERAR